MKPRLLTIIAVLVVALAGCARPAPLDTLWAAPHFDLVDESGSNFSSDALTGQVWVANFIYTHCPDECPIYLSPKMHQLQEDLTAKNLGGQVELISFTVDPRRDTPPVLAEYATRYGADPQVWHFLTGPNATVQDLLQTGFKVGSAIMAMPVTVVPEQAGNGATPDAAMAATTVAGTTTPETPAPGMAMTGTHTMAAQGGHAVAAPAVDGDQAGYTLLHTSFFLLVDQHGQIRKNYDGTQVEVSEMMNDVQQLLRQK